MSVVPKPVTVLASVVPFESCSVAAPAPRSIAPLPAAAALARSSVPARTTVPPA